MVHRITEQEFIPVGCVPAACRPYAGVCFLGGGLPGPGGVCSGGSAWSRGGSVWSGGSAPRGVCPRGGYPSMHWGTHPPPPPADRILDTHLWKYYLGPTSLRPVIICTLNLDASSLVKILFSLKFIFTNGFRLFCRTCCRVIICHWILPNMATKQHCVVGCMVAGCIVLSLDIRWIKMKLSVTIFYCTDIHSANMLKWCRVCWK